jgi:hypothetical protein
MFYIEGLTEVAHHGGYGRYELREELIRLSKRLDTLPPLIILKWCDALEDQWIKEGLDKTQRDIKAFIATRRAMAKL